jgi:SAM-dependent methyltransferase
MDKQTEQNLLKIVKDGYVQIADDFSETRNKRLWPEILELAQVVKEGDRVLDVGCGNGRLVRAFEGKKIKYVGIDNSEELIGLARKNFQYPISNIQFLVGDMLGLDNLIKDKFDFIYSIAVLPHLPGEELRIGALEQMKQKLADGGKIIITAWNLWAQKKYLKLIYEYALKKIVGQNKMDFGDIIFDWKNDKGMILGQRYYHAFTKRELKKVANCSGLAIDRLYKDGYNYYLILKK